MRALATGGIFIPKQRLDSLLVARGLAENRSKALAIIMAGEVTVNGNPQTKAGCLVPADAEICLKQKLPFVSRGGLKLEHALKEFGISAAGLVCLDVGASTGGFTDCLLQNGAERVYALDVGHGQIDYSLRQDKRVTVMEKVNAHYPFELPGKVGLATMDVSFISLTMVLPNILPHLGPHGEVVVLFKPQFEADRKDVGKGGVIRDPAVHAGCIGKFITWMNTNSWSLLNLTASPVTGADGNREFLMHMRPFKP
ncbi:MAG: TlyA family RNA methyltransferase [Chloroflexi bacterium]|nr:TlyA family RNA methyltransferase [Chloroflexota bacterium]